MCLCNIGSGWVGTHAWCHLLRVVQAKFETGMCEVKRTLVQDGLAHMRGVIWRAASAKFKTGMCEMKILGSEVLWCVFATFVQDGLAHMRGVIC